MDANFPYNGGLTAEQFLFYEIRIVSKLYLEDKSLNEIIQIVKKDNLFQFADKHISIDLDDGVIKNYAIFDDVIAKIK